MRTIYYFSIVFLSTAYLICQSCKSNQTEHIYDDFYYPKEDQVYVYQIDSFSALEYWSVSFQKDRYTTDIYSGEFDFEQTVIEKRLPSGVQVEKLTIYEDKDEERQEIPVEIRHGDVFSFRPMASDEVLVYSAAWDQVSDQTHYDLYRNRRFVKDTSFVYQERNYPAIIYKMKEQIVSRNDGDITLNIDVFEVYAKGLGLVQRSKRLENGLERHIYLHNQMTFESFEKLKNE